MGHDDAPPEQAGSEPDSGRGSGPGSEDSHSAERERLSRASILVLGDAILLRRIDGRFGGPDADHGRALRLGRERARPGAGAALVEALGSLGVASAFICVLGDDLAGAELTDIVGRQRNVEPWLLVDGAKSTVTETVYHDGPDPVFRTIREDAHPVAPALRARMVRIAIETLALTGLALIADRGHGTLDIETTSAIIGGARNANRLVVADIGRDRSLARRYAGVDALLMLTDGSTDAERTAGALRLDAEVRAALLFATDGSIAIADKDGTEHLVGAGGMPSDAEQARRVALFAAALATGRTVRGAAAVVARLATA